MIVKTAQYITGVQLPPFKNTHHKYFSTDLHFFWWFFDEIRTIEKDYYFSNQLQVKYNDEVSMLLLYFQTYLNPAIKSNESNEWIHGTCLYGYYEGPLYNAYFVLSNICYQRLYINTEF